jgi:hypothetical protein
MTTRPEGPATATAVGEEPLPELPDLLGLSLTELRRLDHPVLATVLEELRVRLTGDWDALNGFTQFDKSDENVVPGG